jgi:hypothetical protein
MWFWFGLEILRLVYNKAFLKILIGFYLIWAFTFQKNSTTPYKSWKKFSSKLGVQGIKRSGILRWFQKWVELLRQEVLQNFFSEKWYFAKFSNALKIQFSVKNFVPFAKLETSAHFWNQCKISLLLIPCTPNFEDIFFNSYKGRRYFFRRLKGQIR